MPIESEVKSPEMNLPDPVNRPVTDYPSLLPLMFVTHDKTLTFKTKAGKRRFRVVIHGAYNAFGLIGPEMNGVAILSEDEPRSVVLRCIAAQSTGYFGPSRAQIALWNRVCAMEWDQFNEFVLEQFKKSQSRV